MMRGIFKSVFITVMIISLACPAYAQGTPPDPSNASAGTDTKKRCVAEDTKNAANKTFQGRTITSGFGARDVKENANASKDHMGFDLDVANPNVGAFMAGEVKFAGPLGNYGNAITVQTGNLIITYAHSRTMNVKKGDMVSTGQVLGNWVGCTGVCTGDHVHVEYGVIQPDGKVVPTIPSATQALINSGANLNDPDFAAKAIAASNQQCAMGAKATGDINKDDPDYEPTATEMICDKKIFADVQKQVMGVVAARNQIAAALDSPPESISAVANTPCMSQQMASITNQFSNAPSNYASQAVGAVTGNPAGTLVAGVFRSGYNSNMSAMASWPQKIGLQEKFGKAMTAAFAKLGLSNSPFADDVCGLMLDTLLSYIQCTANLSLPSLGNLPTFQFPNSCDAQVARNTAYQAASKSSFDILNQKPGSAGILPRNTPSPGSGTTE